MWWQKEDSYCIFVFGKETSLMCTKVGNWVFDGWQKMLSDWAPGRASQSSEFRVSEWYSFQLDHPKVQHFFLLNHCSLELWNPNLKVIKSFAPFTDILSFKAWYPTFEQLKTFCFVFVFQMMESVLTELLRWWASPTTATMRSTSSMNWFKLLRCVLQLCLSCLHPTNVFLCFGKHSSD